MNCARRLAETPCAICLATMSAAPPAGNGTTTRTGFSGYVCAEAELTHIRTAATRPASFIRSPYASNYHRTTFGLGVCTRNDVHAILYTIASLLTTGIGMASNIEKCLGEIGITLPRPGSPAGNY